LRQRISGGKKWEGFNFFFYEQQLSGEHDGDPDAYAEHF
jgi:hypothetical protein